MSKSPLYRSSTSGKVQEATSSDTIGPISNPSSAQDAATKNYIDTLANVRYADQFAGADMGLKIAAAAADLPSQGGTVDARGFSASETWSTDVLGSFGKPVILLLGVTTITLTHTQTVSADGSMIGFPNDTVFTTTINTGSLFTLGYPFQFNLYGCNFYKTGTAGGTLLNLTGAQFVRISNIPFINGNWADAILLDNNSTSSCIYNAVEDVFIFGPTHACISLKSSTIGKTTNANRFINIICQGDTTATGVLMDASAVATIGENLFLNGDWSGATTGVSVCATARDNVFLGVTLENNTSFGVSVSSSATNTILLGCTISGNGTNVSSASLTTTLMSNVGGITPVFGIDQNGVISAGGVQIGNMKLQPDTGRFGANAVRFQATGTNQEAALTLMPSGSSTDAEFRLYNTSDPANTGSIGLALSGTTLTLFATAFGTGTAPTLFDVSGVSVKTGALDVTSHKISNVTDPTLAQDAATKNYVDTHTGAPAGTTVSTTNDSYTAGQTRTYDLTMAKSFTSWKVTEATGKLFRLRLYATSAARTADASRPFTVPLALGAQHGCILDMYIPQSGAYVTPWIMSPPIIGANGDSSQATTIYASVTNVDTVTRSIQVTISYVALES